MSDFVRVLRYIAHSNLLCVKIGLVAHRGLASPAIQLNDHGIDRVCSEYSMIAWHTFRLGTFRTLSGYFLTYFFLPLREWRAQISLT